MRQRASHKFVMVPSLLVVVSVIQGNFHFGPLDRQARLEPLKMKSHCARCVSGALYLHASLGWLAPTGECNDLRRRRERELRALVS